jgi:hypothetical protein
MRVYYYYQFVYLLVYYNNKTDNAAKLPPYSSAKPQARISICQLDPAKRFPEPPSTSHRHRQRRTRTRKPSAKPFFGSNHHLRCGKVDVYPQGRIVQNPAISTCPGICPRSVQTSHTPYAAGKFTSNPLILWSKRELSTEELAFTIYY